MCNDASARALRTGNDFFVGYLEVKYTSAIGTSVEFAHDDVLQIKYCITYQSKYPFRIF